MTETMTAASLLLKELPLSFVARPFFVAAFSATQTKYPSPYVPSNDRTMRE